jgi:hypothetical protein
MSEMFKDKNNKGWKKTVSKRIQTALVLQVVFAILCVSLITSGVEAKSKFKIEVQICCASSDSGSVKIKVKLPDGTSTSKKANLAKLAEAQDWDNVSVFIKLKHRYESFRVCVSGLGCQWGAAGEGPVQFKGFH